MTKRQIIANTKKETDLLIETVNGVDGLVSGVIKEAETIVKPVRRSVLKRFPIAFSLLVTFGVAAVFYGFERVLMEVSYLNDKPFLILLLGIGVLALTGTLYKKLA